MVPQTAPRIYQQGIYRLVQQWDSCVNVKDELNIAINEKLNSVTEQIVITKDAQLSNFIEQHNSFIITRISSGTSPGK